MIFNIIKLIITESIWILFKQGVLIMMKWKARTETTNIGTLELGNVTFDEDNICTLVDIWDMSDSLKAEIDKAVEIEKVKYTEKNRSTNEKYGHNSPVEWSDKPPVIDDTYLWIFLKGGGEIECSIQIAFHDADNEMMDECASITVDLSEHMNELKKAVIKVMLDRFF